MKKLFGSSSERRSDDIPGQQNLFDEAEMEQVPSLLEEETAIWEHTHKKKARLQHPLSHGRCIRSMRMGCLSTVRRKTGNSIVQRSAGRHLPTGSFTARSITSSQCMITVSRRYRESSTATFCLRSKTPLTKNIPAILFPELTPVQWYTQWLRWQKHMT